MSSAYLTEKCTDEYGIIEDHSFDLGKQGFRSFADGGDDVGGVPDFSLNGFFGGIGKVGHGYVGGCHGLGIVLSDCWWSVIESANEQAGHHLDCMQLLIVCQTPHSHICECGVPMVEYKQ